MNNVVKEQKELREQSNELENKKYQIKIKNQK